MKPLRSWSAQQPAPSSVCLFCSTHVLQLAPLPCCPGQAFCTAAAHAGGGGGGVGGAGVGGAGVGGGGGGVGVGGVGAGVGSVGVGGGVGGGVGAAVRTVKLHTRPTAAVFPAASTASTRQYHVELRGSGARGTACTLQPPGSGEAPPRGCSAPALGPK